MRVLVTGGAGFIGRTSPTSCSLTGTTSCVLDDLSGGFEANVPDRGDLRRRLGRPTPSWSTSCSRRTRSSPSSTSPPTRPKGCRTSSAGSTTRTTSIGSRQRAQRRAARARRSSASSSPARSRSTGRPRRRCRRTACRSPRIRTAREVRGRARPRRGAARCSGLDYTIFRPLNVYGERQNLADPYTDVIGDLHNQVDGRSTTDDRSFEDGLQTRDFIDMRRPRSAAARSRRRSRTARTEHLQPRQPTRATAIVEVAQRDRAGSTRRSSRRS